MNDTQVLLQLLAALPQRHRPDHSFGCHYGLIFVSSSHIGVPQEAQRNVSIMHTPGTESDGLSVTSPIRRGGFIGELRRLNGLIKYLRML